MMERFEVFPCRLDSLSQWHSCLLCRHTLDSLSQWHSCLLCRHTLQTVIVCMRPQKATLGSESNNSADTTYQTVKDLH